jgi:hypothetical protein
MDNKVNQAQLRFSNDQLLYIQRAHQHYEQSNDEVITRSEFMRRMLMVACAMEVGDIEIAPKLVKAEPEQYSCACLEVHTCGADK